MVKYLLVEDERFAYEELKRMMRALPGSWRAGQRAWSRLYCSCVRAAWT